MAEYPAYQTAFLCMALASVLVLGGWLYWVTSESYRIRKMQIQLGYKVPSIRSYFSWVCVCCVAPLVRRKWEKENTHFRTDDYAKLRRRRPPLKAFLDDGGEWMALPRGDSSRHKQLVKVALAKIRANVIHDVIDEALELALSGYTAAATESREEERAAERVRAMASRWRKQSDPMADKHEELSAMIATYAAEDSSDDDGDYEDPEWAGMGPSISFMNLAPSPNGKANNHRRESKRTKRLPNDVHNTRPAIHPSTFGDWGDTTAGPAQSTAATANLVRPTVSPITYGSWAGNGPKPVAVDKAAASQPIARVPGSRRIALSELKRLARDMTPESISPEFNKIPRNQPRATMLNAAAHALTANLQLFPFPHSRVKGPKGLYINASYIRGADGFPSKYIGTQVPVVPGSGGFGQKLPSVNLFWEMVLDHRSTVLVTLDESGAPFWPVELSKPSKYGALEVTATKMVPNDDYTAISLEIARAGGSQAHHATLFEFHRWSKTMTNDGVSALLELSSAIGAATKESPSTPIIMIDADGGDRVGTMIAAEHCFEQIRTQDYVDVMRAVADVREDRGGLVSQPELYATIYRLATIYLLGMGVSMNRTDAPPAYAGAPRY